MKNYKFGNKIRCFGQNIRNKFAKKIKVIQVCFNTMLTLTKLVTTISMMKVRRQKQLIDQNVGSP